MPTIPSDIVAIPFVGGVDTKSDAKTVMPTKLVKLINGEFTERGSIKRRPGYDEIANVEGAVGIATRQDELLIATKSSLYTYNEDRGETTAAGDFTCVTHTAADIATNSGIIQTYPDMVTNGPITVVAWEQEDDIYFSVYSSTSQTPYAVNQLAKTSSERVRVLAVGPYIAVIYANSASNSIFAKIINTVDLTTIDDAEVTLAIDLETTNYYDAVSDGTYIHLAYDSDGSVEPGLRYKKLTSGGTLVNFIDSASTPTPLSEYPATCGVSIAYHGGYIALAAEVDEGATNVTRLYRINADTTTVTQTGSAATDASAITGLSVGIIPTNGHIALATQGTNAEGVRFRNYEPLIATLTGTTIDTIYGPVKLNSSGFSDDTNCYFLLGHNSATGLQHSCFLYRHDAILLGRALYGSAPGELTLQHYPRPSLLSEGKYQMAIQYRKALQITSNNTGRSNQYNPYGIKRIVFNTDPQVESATVGQSTYLNGSQLWQYDGQNVTESGFHLFPDSTTTPTTDTGGTPVLEDTKQYSYRCYYEWVKANGERERSAAITRSVTMGGSGPYRALLSIPRLPFTLKEDPYIVVYRSTGNSTTGLFYRCSGLDPNTTTGENAWLPNPSTGSVSFIDNMSDATLQTKEWDYANTGEVLNIQPDGPEHLGIAQSRLWMAGGGERYNNLRFSKLRSDGEPVAFSEVLEVTDAPERGGRTVGVSYVNNTPIVFKERLIYGLAGEGPDNLGQSGSYVIQQISADMGCTDPGSIVPFIGGIIFKSAKGIYLLNQGLSLDYIGADVEAYNGQTITSARAIPDSNQIIFLTGDGLSLLYDYYYKAWSTFSNHEGISSVAWKETDYAYLRNDGRVYLRNPDVYLDAGAPYKLRARTAPLRIKDTLQGRWLARRLFLLGDYMSSHKLKVKVYYNREGAAFETFTFDPSTVISSSTWGSDATWGSGSYWGGNRNSNEYQFERKLKRQKCQTIAFEFYDVGAVGPSYEITELLLEYGLLEGPASLATARKI